MLTSNTEITATIDWLSITADKIIHPSQFTKDVIPLKNGRLNYDSGITYLDGRIELWHSERPEMKRHLIMSGDCLALLSVTYDMSILQIVSAYHYGRASRLDIAIDIKNGSLDIERLSRELTDGEVDTKAEGGLYLTGIGTQDGETLYVGSPKASRRLRIYDKAAESGQTEKEWTRIELQTRHNHARLTLATLMIEKDVSIIPQLINDYAHWNKSPEWVQVTGIEKMRLLRGIPSKSARRRWILNTVAKAIAKEIFAVGDDEIISTLLKHIIAEKEMIMQKLTKSDKL